MVDCAIPQKRMRAFSKLIACLARIADELCIEATSDALIFRSINSSKSAYAGAQLPAAFFDEFRCEKKPPHCRIQLKPCHAIFKFVPNVDRCRIFIDENDPRVVFELHCRMGVKKVFKLTYEEAQPMQAIYDKESSTNALSSRPKILQDTVQSFANAIEEITLITTRNGIKLKSYQEPEKVLNKTLQSEVALHATDFDSFKTADGTPELTFTLKEVKAIVTLADVLGANVNIAWEQKAGKPIIFSVDSSSLIPLSADFVLATQLDTTQESQNTATPAASESSSSRPQTPPPPSSSASISSAPHTSGGSRGALSGLSPVGQIPGLGDLSGRSEADRQRKRAAASNSSHSDSEGRSDAGDDRASPTAKRGKNDSVLAPPPPPPPLKGPVKLPSANPLPRSLWVTNVNDDEEDEVMGDGAMPGSEG